MAQGAIFVRMLASMCSAMPCRFSKHQLLKLRKGRLPEACPQIHDKLIQMGEAEGQNESLVPTDARSRTSIMDTISKKLEIPMFMIGIGRNHGVVKDNQQDHLDQERYSHRLYFLVSQVAFLDPFQ